MDVNQDIEKSRWWMLNKLKRESIVYDKISFTFDTQEKDDKYTRKQQQKLLDQLARTGVIKCLPVHTNLDDYAVISGQQDHWDSRNYEVSLVQPAFDSLYAELGKIHPYHQLEPIDRSVTYKAATIEQGHAHHTFKQTPELVAIMSILWPKRRVLVDSIIERNGTPCDMESLRNNLLDSAPKIEPKRIADLCDAFNKTMGRKHIDARIIRKGGIVIEVDQSAGQ